MTLREWQLAVLPRLREMRFAPSPIGNVTLLAYFFWRDARIETEFPALECAFLAAFRCFGLLPGVIVANRATMRMREFAARYGIEIQIEPALDSPRGLEALSVDSMMKMHTRFKTEYVLTIQTDGIPVNPGLERFLGKWDFTGAPSPGHLRWFDFFPYRWFPVFNGGLSLRSRAICAACAEAYGAIPRWVPYHWFFFGDDTFYTRTMRFFSARWRRRFRFPSIPESLEFSVMFDYPPPTVKPLGFHSPNGFDLYCRNFGVPFADLLGR